MSDTPGDPSPRIRQPFARRLPLAAPLRLNRPSDTWFKPALSVVAASAVPHLTLLALGRLDLVMYTMAGSLCALYGHGLPYARRARTVAGVVLSMTAGLAAALVTASLTHSTAVLVAVGALLAATQKAACDAVRIGPPGHVILTFVSSAALFAPQRLGQVPAHLALTLGAGAVAWLVCVGPALIRREGPERRAVARALEAAADRVAEPGPRTRHTAAAAVHGAWQCLLASGRPTPVRRSLERLVVHAETALSDPDRLRAWAALTRARGPVPEPPPAPGTAAELYGIGAERAALRASSGRRAARRTLLRSLGPGSHLLPVAVRTLIGCALAGYLCAALGVGRPYWAIVTAASLYQANTTLTWNRTLQRTLGNLLGVLVFAAVLPLSRTGPLALVLCCLLFSFAAEALITRNYWLGSVAVTPMALLVLEFGGTHPAGELVGDRVLDTVLGALAGFLAAALVTNRRAAGRVERALEAAAQARTDAERAYADRDRTGPAGLDRARRALTARLVELREAADIAAGEWWQRALPEQELLAAERAGHRTLAATAQRLGPPVRAPETRRGAVAPAPANGAA
ncbi:MULTISPECIES: FUSC family protein [Streptomyces]|uniref:FUSC family protein n=1 Tax=Streptomyces TaxID=1883 RepID=UPI001929F296|nr:MULTISPECIES: FUSC family protein [unclassified Streptomyces]CAD5923493.1 Fusaric acid resistance protein family protein [Streptomyces sp. KY70]CAD5990767.1 Fusaric acid resistance protein family protein [Streptomyces sp. KY75]